MFKIKLLIKVISLLKQVIHLRQTILIKKLKSKPYYGDKIRAMIGLIAEQEKVNIYLAQKVAWCESRYNPVAINEIPYRGYDRGLYQWNNYYHPEISDKCAYDPECSCRAFCKAVKEGHLFWWTPSKHCWDK